jgi:hypothetical protein
MSNLQKAIADKFIDALGKENSFDADMVKNLRDLLGSNKKLKSDDLVKVFTSSPDKAVR